MSSARLRRDLDTLPAYVAGKPALATGGRAYKLSSNELPYPPDPAVIEAVAAAVAAANRYPSATGAGLTSALSQRLSVPAERIVVGGGSIALLQLLLQTVTDPADAAVFAWRSYEAYPIVASVCHARPVPVPLDAQHRHDLPAMATAVRRTGARIVLVCSPNNPTGTAITAGELDEFIASVSRECVIVLDEAYAEFNDGPAAPDGISLARRHPNVVVLRTFSKAHGLAGMRVGYCVAPPRLAEAMRRVGLPFPVSAVAEAAALAALAVWPRQRARVARIIEARDAFAAAMRGAGYEIPDSRANFVWVPLGDASRALDDALREAGLSVRTFPGEGVRITIGEPEALDVVLDVARRAARAGS